MHLKTLPFDRPRVNNSSRQPREVGGTQSPHLKDVKTETQSRATAALISQLSRPGERSFSELPAPA